MRRIEMPKNSKILIKLFHYNKTFSYDLKFWHSFSRRARGKTNN